MKKTAMALLSGPAQIMFQPSATTGVLFLAGILWGAVTSGHVEVALGAVVGLVVSTLTGYILGLPHDEGEVGLWGFNGTLMGIAILTFLRSSPETWVALVLSSAMTTWVRTGLNNISSAHGINSLTFPFVLCSWLFLASSRIFAGLDGVALSHPMLPAIHLSDWAAAMPTSVWEAVEWPLRGIGQILLQDSWVSGALFLVGLLVSSPRAALWAFIGSAIGTYGAIWMGGSTVAVESGLYGFSPALTAIALGAIFYPASPGSTLWALLGTLATIFVQGATNIFLEPLGLPALTAPFCLTTWLFLLPRIAIGSHRTATPSSPPDHSNWHKPKAESRA